MWSPCKKSRPQGRIGDIYASRAACYDVGAGTAAKIEKCGAEGEKQSLKDLG